MNTLKLTSIAIAALSSPLVMAGAQEIPLGRPVPQLGDQNPALGIIEPSLGSDLSMPTLAVIAVIALVGGIRYIRNKRS